MFPPPDKSQNGPAPGTILNPEPNQEPTNNARITKKDSSRPFSSGNSGLQKANTLLTTPWGSSLKVEPEGEIISFQEYYNRLLIRAEEAEEDRFFDDPPVCLDELEESVGRKISLDQKLQSVFFFKVIYTFEKGSIGYNKILQDDEADATVSDHVQLEDGMFEKLLLNNFGKGKKSDTQGEGVLGNLGNLMKQGADSPKKDADLNNSAKVETNMFNKVLVNQKLRKNT
jgi:hypothetical protein